MIMIIRLKKNCNDTDEGQNNKDSHGNMQISGWFIRPNRPE